MSATSSEPLRPIEPRSRKVVVSLVYCAYGDESRDETALRVYAVAGIFGSQEDWSALEGQWAERLGGKVFHAADCECGYGEFSGIPKSERLGLYRDLTTLVVKSKLMGVATAINVADFSESFPEEDQHAPYIWGFADVVENMAQLAFVSMPSDTVKIVFDRNQDVQYNAIEIYNFLVHSKRLASTLRQHLADEVSFACRRTLGVQVADLIARESMKNLDANASNSGRPTRQSFQALRDTRRFSFAEQGKAYIEELKAKHAAKSIPNATQAAYKQWLADKRLVDCLSNSIAHLKAFPDLWDVK
jgi:hypothetical protein